MFGAGCSYHDSITRDFLRDALVKAIGPTLGAPFPCGGLTQDPVRTALLKKRRALDP